MPPLPAGRRRWRRRQCQCQPRAGRRHCGSPGSSLRPAPVAQAPWFGHPAQPSALPAASEAGPTQPSLAFSGAVGDSEPAAGESAISRHRTFLRLPVSPALTRARMQREQPSCLRTEKGSACRGVSRRRQPTGTTARAAQRAEPRPRRTCMRHFKGRQARVTVYSSSASRVLGVLCSTRTLCSKRTQEFEARCARMP